MWCHGKLLAIAELIGANLYHEPKMELTILPIRSKVANKCVGKLKEM